MSADFDEFVNQHFPPEQHPIVAQLRDLLRDAAPQAREAVSYNMPVWLGGRNIIAYINSSKTGVTLSFVQGVLFEDRFGLLRGSAKWARFVKIGKPEKINVEALQDYVRQAVEIEARQAESS